MAAQDNLEATLTSLVRVHDSSRINEAGQLVLPTHALLPMLRQFGDVANLEDGYTATLASLPDCELSVSEILGLFKQLSAAASIDSASHSTGNPLVFKDGHTSSVEEVLSSRNLFQGRERSTPLESVSKKRPQRMRGRSDNYYGTLTGTENSAPGPSIVTHTRHPPAFVRSVTSPTSHRPSHSRSPSFGLSPRSPEASLYDHSFISTPLRSPDFTSYGSGSRSSSFSELQQRPPSGIVSPRFSYIPDHSLLYPLSDENEDEDGQDLDYDSDLLDRTPSEEDEDETIHSPLAAQNAAEAANAALAKKQRELEQILGVHESEIEEMQQRIEDLRSELGAARKEEKELKFKTRSTLNQIQTLEGENSRLARQLEGSRSSYQSLQKQYQEQCIIAEKYRESIIKKSQELQDAQDIAGVHRAEAAKWKRAHEQAEATLAQLHSDLSRAQQTEGTLLEQRRANVELGETIARLRGEIDDLQQGAVTSSKQSSGSASSSSEHLLLPTGRLGTGPRNGASLAVEMENAADRQTEDAPTQSIITTRRRVFSRTPPVMVVTETLKKPDMKDAGSQHDLPPISVESIGSQTEQSSPVQSHSSIPGPSRTVLSRTTQTSPLRPSHLVLDSTRSNDVFDETMIDSDSESSDSGSTADVTLVGLTPSPSASIDKRPSKDLPPSYDAHLAAEKRQKARQEYIQRWHPGMSPTKAIRTLTAPPNEDISETNVASVSREAVEEWKNLKAELGFECRAIDVALLGADAPPTDDCMKKEDVGLTREILTMTPRLAREWAKKVKAAVDEHEDSDASLDTPRVLMRSRTSRLRRASSRYSYNTRTVENLPTDDDETQGRSWNVVLAGLGVWAAVVMAAAVIPAIQNEFSEGLPSSDMRLWTQYNTFEHIPGTSSRDGTVPVVAGQAAGDAIWTVAGHLVYGAANVVRRAPPT